MWWISVSTVLTDRLYALRRYISIALAAAILNCLPVGAEEQTREPLTIFAAASLSDVLPVLLEQWQNMTEGPGARTSFAASAVLARQIEAGAPADLFLSANKKWVNHIADGKFTGASVAPIAHNKLVFAIPCRLQGIEQQSIEELGSFLQSVRFVMADPAIAPAGEYAHQFLERQNLWQRVKDNAAYAGNARLALLLIERGGLPVRKRHCIQ